MGCWATARVTDIGSHMNVMITGSGDVITNNLNTHRCTDLQVCPIHGLGATLANCTPLVITNNLQTAHILSICFCGPPSVIVTGSPDTNVGD